MELYKAEDKVNYVLLTLGNNELYEDKKLPIADTIPELSYAKNRKIVLDVTNITKISSAILTYIVTLISNSPKQKADVIDSAPGNKNISLEDLLTGTNLRKYVNMYSSAEEYEANNSIERKIIKTI